MSVKLDPSAVAPLAVSRRSGADESLHLGVGVVLDPSGAVTSSVGDPGSAVYLRSALKIVQATALVRIGLDLPDRLLALVAASHSGGAGHLDGVEQILRLHGLGTDDLANTPALPYGERERELIDRHSATPSALFQNCSGKHAGMLGACRVNGWSTTGYLDPDHPVQRSIRTTSESLGARVEHVGVDGCGAPAFVVGVRAGADAVRRLALADDAVLRAMRGFPTMVGGDGRDVTSWMQVVPGLVAKDGAAGVMVLTIAAGERRGWTALFKVADGSDAARRAVVPAALAAMGVDVERSVADGAPSAGGHLVGGVPVLGGGRPVGSIEPVTWAPVGPVRT